MPRSTHGADYDCYPDGEDPEPRIFEQVETAAFLGLLYGYDADVGRILRRITCILNIIRQKRLRLPHIVCRFCVEVRRLCPFSRSVEPLVREEDRGGDQMYSARHDSQEGKVAGYVQSLARQGEQLGGNNRQE